MIGSKAARQTLYVRQGSDWSATFQLKDASGTPIALAGSSFSGQIRRTKSIGTVAATFTFSIDVVNNRVQYSLSRSVSSAMVAGENDTDPDSKYVYDIEWTSAIGNVERVQEGVLVLSREVTR